eukprot:1185642-Prorocentrum_minimum.AAC.1
MDLLGRASAQPLRTQVAVEIFVLQYQKQGCPAIHGATEQQAGKKYNREQERFCVRRPRGHGTSHVGGFHFQG